MFIVFFGESFFVVLVILLALCFFGVLGSVYAVLTLLLEHWYVVLFAMFLKMLLDNLFYSIISSRTSVKSESDKFLLKKNKNKIFIINVLKSFLVFISFVLFCDFQIKIVAERPIISVLYAILYLFALFFTFISTYIIGMSVLESRVNYKLEDWNVFKYHNGVIVTFVCISLVFVMPISFFSFLLLCISSWSSFLLSCKSSVE